MAKDNRTLYAVAVEGWNRRTRKWVADIVYIHAENEVHARNQYYVGHPNRRTSRIVAVGPVVGMFADDDEGKILYTDEGFR